MHIIIFTHPDFTEALSISKYTLMLAEHMKKKDHTVEIWTANRFFCNLPFPKPAKKWLGYVDQFLLFPITIRKKLKKCPADTLFVFADQALGPWVPMVSDRPHVIHCHDFLALRSSLNEFPENNLKVTGKVYQKLILNGFRKGRNFISISQKTQSDLHHFLGQIPQSSEMVYNGLNQDFRIADVFHVRQKLKEVLDLNLKNGYVLHVGGNQFYKNRIGALKIYVQWRRNSHTSLPFLLVGPPPTSEINRFINESGFSGDIHCLHNMSDELLQMAYQGATTLLFPSLAEGFGWPIAEAMASGCPVITTDEAPMNEVGGASCFYVPVHSAKEAEVGEWARKCAAILEEVVSLPAENRENVVKEGLENAKRFNTIKSLNQIESVYTRVLAGYSKNLQYSIT